MSHWQDSAPTLVGPPTIRGDDRVNSDKTSPPVRDPMLWSGDDYASPVGYTVCLKDHDVAEIKEGLASFKSCELDGDAVNKTNFPLPTLEHTLNDVSREIHQGRGFSVIRGLDPKTIATEDAVTLFLGISSYIGGHRGLQNAQGDVLVHVTDSSDWDAVPKDKRHGIHGNSSLPFHCDMGADILALQIRHLATSGGATYLASARTIYNELVRTNPAALEALLAPEWRIQVSGNGRRHILAPLIEYHCDKVMISLDPGRLGLHPASDQVDSEVPTMPVLSPKQTEALLVLNNIAAQHALKLELQAGDLLFVNNWAIMHARDSFDAVTIPDNRRHLVRMWLSNPDLAWPVPPSMKVPRQAAFGYLDHEVSGKAVWHRGHFVEPQYHINPAKEYKVPKYTAGSAAFVLEDDEEEDWQTFFH